MMLDGGLTHPSQMPRMKLANEEAGLNQCNQHYCGQTTSLSNKVTVSVLIAVSVHSELREAENMSVLGPASYKFKMFNVIR